jgi:hypothetical protein
MEERHSQSGGMPASFRPSPKRRPGHGPGSNLGSEHDIGSGHNRQDGNSNLGDLRLRSLSPPDSDTGTREPNSRVGTSGQTNRNRHYHHRNDLRKTNHHRYPTQKWGPGGHPADNKKKSRGSSVFSITGLSKLLALDQSSIQRTWESHGRGI